MYIGKPLRRREDAKFLKGRGRYVDDIMPRDAAWVAFVRSPHAHARILAIETGAAAAIPGVLRVLTADDWRAAGLGELTCVHPMPFSDGRPMNEALRPVFAADKVRHVGDVVAAVVAEDRAAALDAAEAVAVGYEALPSVTDFARALDAWGSTDLEILNVGDERKWFAQADLFIAPGAPKMVFEPIARFFAARD